LKQNIQHHWPYNGQAYKQSQLCRYGTTDKS